MLDITHLNGVALVKKKGNKLYVVSDPEDVADESPIRCRKARLLAWPLVHCRFRIVFLLESHAYPGE